jgi:hypothetical protein
MRQNGLPFVRIGLVNAPRLDKIAHLPGDQYRGRLQ